MVLERVRRERICYTIQSSSLAWKNDANQIKAIIAQHMQQYSNSSIGTFKSRVITVRERIEDSKYSQTIQKRRKEVGVQVLPRLSGIQVIDEI